MDITLKRNLPYADIVQGDIYIEDNHMCHTLEHRQAALPKGTYHIVRHYCKQANRLMPLLVRGQNLDTLEKRCQRCKLLDEPNNNTLLPCYCPQLKPGNGVHKRRDGRILVGELATNGCLLHSQQHFERLYERIRKNLVRDYEINLVVE